MSATKRAGGWWWVRVDETSRWYVGEVHDNELTVDRLDEDAEPGDGWRLDGDFEWGPYLGTKPQRS